MNSARKFQRLSGPERWLLIQALFLLPLIALALRLGGFRRCQSALTRLAPRNERRIDDQPESRLPRARVIAGAVKAAAWHGSYRPNCLQQSLTLWWLLRCQGMDGELRIGARREASGLEAHAWVEFEGLALNESQDVRRRFAPFDRVMAPVGVKPQ